MYLQIINFCALHPCIAEVTGVTCGLCHFAPSPYKPPRPLSLPPIICPSPPLPIPLSLFISSSPTTITMPSGVGVVETFKSASSPPGQTPHYLHLTPPSNPDLIRHGKAHQGQRQDGADLDFVSPEHQQQRQHRVLPPKEKDPPEGPKHHNEPKDHRKAADYSREAEMIVKEERQAKNNMPQYKGLERYRILEKMGELVVPSHHTLIGVVLSADPSRTTAVHSQMFTRLKISRLDRKSPVRRNSVIIPPLLTYSFYSQSRSEIRVELTTG